MELAPIRSSTCMIEFDVPTDAELLKVVEALHHPEELKQCLD